MNVCEKIDFFPSVIRLMSELTCLREENARLHALVHILTDALEDAQAPVFPYVVRAEDSVIRVYYHFDLKNAIMELPASECTIAVLRNGGVCENYDHKGYIRDFLRDAMNVQADDRYRYIINIHRIGRTCSYFPLYIGHATYKSGDSHYSVSMVNVHRIRQHPKPRPEMALRLVQEIHALGVLPVLMSDDK